MKKILFVFFCMATWTMLPAQTHPDDNILKPETFQANNGISLPYRLVTPENMNPKKKYPLVIFLHGSGERGNDNVSQLLHGGRMWANPVNREKYPTYVLIPQCPKNDSWSGYSKIIPESFYALKQLINHYVALSTVDKRRIYVMGISMGGMCTFQLATRYPELFAAAVPICGSIDPKRLASAKNIKFSLYHGDRDEAVPVEGSRRAYKALKELGASVRYKEYPGMGHPCWNTAFAEPDFMEWLFKQKK